jgi:hypothetical protein
MSYCPLNRRSPRRFLAYALFLVTAACPAATAGGLKPADELLRYVPADVGFCLVARDLRDHGAALADSPFVAGLRKTKAGEAIIQADEFARLGKIQEQLQKQLGLDWEKLGKDIFGDGIAFAYRPGPPGKPDDEEGLLLVRARAAKPLADFVDRLNEIQKSNGEVKEIEQRSSKGATYFCRVEKDKPPSYYCLRGPVLMLSGKEPMLLRALELERATPPEAEGAVGRELRLLGSDRAVLSVWVNPRAFDAELAARARAPGPDAAGLKAFERYWKALDGVAVSLNLDKDLSLSVALRGRADQLPDAARRFLVEAARPSDLWRSFPDRVLVAGAVRVDPASLLGMMSDFLPPEGGPALAGELNRALGPPSGKDVVKEVIPCLGPDLGFCLFAPPAGEKNWSPQGFAALKVAPGSAATPVDQSVLATVHFFTALAVLAHNGTDPAHQLSLKTMTQDKREVRYLAGEGIFPPGVRPAFGLHSGYLVVATSPETLLRFAPAPAPVPQSGEATPLLRIGLKEWREYLKERGTPLAQALAEKDGADPADVRARVESAVTALELFDRIEIIQRVSPGQFTLAVTLQTALPLKK